MAVSGLLGKSSLSATTNTTVYQVPASGVTSTVLNVNMVNTTSSAISVRLAISTVAAPAATDWIEYDFPLPAHETLERTAIVASPGERVVAYSSAAGITVRVHGFEK